MELRKFGRLGDVSALTRGGCGIGQVWGPTSRAEAVATVREAVDSGITFLDVAPSYGNGEAESRGKLEPTVMARVDEAVAGS